VLLLLSPAQRHCHGQYVHTVGFNRNGFSLGEVIPKFSHFGPGYYYRAGTVLQKQALVLRDVGTEDEHVPKKPVRSPLISDESEDLGATWFPCLTFPGSRSQVFEARHRSTSSSGWHC